MFALLRMHWQLFCYAASYMHNIYLWHIAIDVWRGRSVCRHTEVSCKNGWTDRDALGIWARVGHSKHILDGDPDPLQGNGHARYIQQHDAAF